MYLGIWIDYKLSFNVHIANLIRKLKIKLGFYFINKSNLTFNAKKKLIESTFLTVLDYGDILYMHASSILTSLESVYHASLRFISSLSLYSYLSLFWQLPATLFQVFAFERTLSLYRTWENCIFECTLGME